jgi:hypothetical protein
MNLYKKLFGLLFLLLFFGVAKEVNAQTLPVGLLQNIEDTWRRQQLLGNDSSNTSYMIRPLSLNGGNVVLDRDKNNNVTDLNSFRKHLFQSDDGMINVFLLPIAVQQQINGHNSFGMNDNSMISAKGYQVMVSGGLYATVGPLSIQLRPEYVYARNSYFNELESVGNDLYFAYPKLVFNKIDNPSIHGEDKRYRKGSWGQSSIRLNVKSFSFGLSNENLWWGPGKKNSLIMSNNAPGFKHLTLNTTRPVDIFIGTLEAQVIAGRLEASNVDLPRNQRNVAEYTYVEKPKDSRYIAGFTFAYQPKWVPNLFLGYDRVSTGYDFGSNTVLVYYSGSARWVMPESKAEAYVQYGINNHTGNVKDSRAYIVGFNKLLPLVNKDQFIEVGVEFTQLETPRNNSYKIAPSWYTDDAVVHGYTNKGEIIGAGIGPGSNMQSLDVSWVKGLKKIGLSFDRILNNNDFFYNAGSYISEPRRHWVDLAFSSKLNWNFGKIIFNGEFTYIKSLNYHYFLIDHGQFYWDWPKQDQGNLHGKLGMIYNF